jgi:hypothetical protein
VSRPGARALRVLPQPLAVARLDAEAPWPDWLAGSLWSVTRTPYELSIVCEQSVLPDGLDAERDWRALEVVGPIAFSEVGVLASMALPLRDADVSIFAVSTFDTDYVLVRGADLDRALKALEQAGWIRQSA